MHYNELSKDAQETLKGMVEYCIENDYCMGMDKGFRKNGQKRSFRVQLEKFSKYKS